MNQTAKIYAETKGKEPFNWNAFLTAAIASPPSIERWDEVELRSKSWVTCSVGTQCHVIPRHLEGSLGGKPLDELLAHLGGCNGGFHSAIMAKDPVLALHILGLVERHSAYLIRQEAARRKSLFEKAAEAWEEVKSWWDGSKAA